MSNTEYQVEYCGQGGRSGGGGGKKGGGQSGVVGCSKSYEDQPVGGRTQEKARKDAMDASKAELTMYDTDYNKETCATRHDPAPKGGAPGGGNFTHSYAMDPTFSHTRYMFPSSEIEGMRMAAPDVHKLRYMSNNYMTPDDWH